MEAELPKNIMWVELILTYAYWALSPTGCSRWVSLTLRNQLNGLVSFALIFIWLDKYALLSHNQTEVIILHYKCRALFTDHQPLIQIKIWFVFRFFNTETQAYLKCSLVKFFVSHLSYLKYFVRQLTILLKTLRK